MTSTCDVVDPECPGPDCPMCSGAMCALCGAGCWNGSVRDCEHATDERHQEPKPKASTNSSCGHPAIVLARAKRMGHITIRERVDEVAAIKAADLDKDSVI